jgi:hypothetical protein
MKEKIARWYDRGWWSDEAVKEAVGKLITTQDYEDITGNKYKGVK